MPVQVTTNTARAFLTRGVEARVDGSALLTPDVSFSDGFSLQQATHCGDFDLSRECVDLHGLGSVFSDITQTPKN